MGRVGVRSRSKHSEYLGLDRTLLDILCCPVTRTPLELLPERELTLLNDFLLRLREELALSGPPQPSP